MEIISICLIKLHIFVLESLAIVTLINGIRFHKEKTSSYSKEKKKEIDGDEFVTQVAIQLVSFCQSIKIVRELRSKLK